MKNLKKSRRLIKAGAIVVAAGMALTFTACSTNSGDHDNSSDNSSESPSSSPGENSGGEYAEIREMVPDKYKEEGIKAAAYNDWAPAEFLDEDGELVGWSIDLAHEIADVLGVDITIDGTTFESVLPGLKSKKYDAGFASFGPTDERLQAMDMVGEVVDGTGYASLKENDFDIKETADLCGHSVAVIVGAFDMQYLTEQNTKVCDAEGLDSIELEQYKTQSDAQLGVTSGRVDFVAAGSQKLQYLVQQQDNTEVSDLISNPVYNCIGVRKDDPLGKAMTAAIQELIDSGEYEEILAKWGITTGLMDEAVLITSENPDPELPKA